MTRSNDGIDVAVIGAGPAGLAAATKAKETGADSVTIIERGEGPGGLLFQCIHNGFGLQEFKEDLTGPEYAHRLIEKARDLNVDMLFSTMVLEISSDNRLLLSNSASGLMELQPKAVVLAMGCREQTRQGLMIPGTRPAGVYTAGTAQRYINVEGYMPGKEFVILGSGDIGMIVARRLILEGARVKAMVEIQPFVGGLIRNEVQCLYDFDIPLLLEHTVIDIHGLERVEAVTVAKVDGEGEVIAGTEKTIQCDTLLLSAGLIPENELSVRAGVNLDPLTGGPIVNDSLETTVAGIFAGGNVVHVHDLVDNVSREASEAGCRAAEHAMGKTQSRRRGITLRAGNNIRYVVPQRICCDGETTLYARVKRPADKVKLMIGDIFQKAYRAVRPSEMIKVHLASKELDMIKTGTEELVLSCE